MSSEGDEALPSADASFSIHVQQVEGETVVTAHIAAEAEFCYALFCDADLIPEWLWVVDRAIVQRRDERRRALEVDFLGALERASIGYTLRYSYDDERREVTWHHQGRGVKELVGRARFVDRPEGGCTLTYVLASSLARGLPPWADQLYQQRPAEAVVLDFCEFVERKRADA